MFTTLLFAPGDNDRKMGKALNSGADVVILDLEDSVASTAKEEARQLTGNFLKATNSQKAQRFVRVNAFDSELTQADVAAVLPFAPDGIVLPKACGQADVLAIGALLTKYERPEHQGQTRLITIVTETADSVLALMRDKIAHPRLVGMMWGAEDLSADLGASSNYADGTYTEPFRFARNLCLLAARAANVVPIDAVYADYKDEAGLRHHAVEGCRDGFAAKAAIHPAQLPVIEKAFKPTQEQIDWAKQVIAIFEKTITGVASLDGKMLDKPHLRMAENILSRQ